MTVVARFTGGPRHGRKNNLQGNDLAPLYIPVPAKDAKAINIAPGRYVLDDESEDTKTAYYVWRPLKEKAQA